MADIQSIKAFDCDITVGDVLRFYLGETGKNGFVNRSYGCFCFSEDMNRGCPEPLTDFLDCTPGYEIECDDEHKEKCLRNSTDELCDGCDKRIIVSMKREK